MKQSNIPQVILLAMISVSLASAITSVILLPTITTKYQKIELPTPPLAHVEIKSPLTHQQIVWTYSLEWCESRGVESAINPNDRDNTPSYYSFQWKPSTFLYFAKIYKVIPATTTPTESSKIMRDYTKQRAVIEAMVLDSKHINWHQQFPDCVARLGYPPKAQ